MSLALLLPGLLSHLKLPHKAEEGPVLALGADFPALLCSQDKCSDGSSPENRQCVLAALGLMMNLLLESNDTIQVCNFCELNTNVGVAGYF